MPYAIELYFDKETESDFLGLANRIAEKGISTRYLEWKTRPHITLACFNDVDEAECIERLKRFSRNHTKMPVSFSSVGMFNDTRVVFISPDMTHSLYQFQRELHEAFAGSDTKGWEWYLPDEWVPHCAVALTKEDDEEAFYQASNLILREFRKTDGRFEAIGLVKITFPVEEIFTASLHDPV